jgi:hypothetical protein
MKNIYNKPIINKTVINKTMRYKIPPKTESEYISQKISINIDTDYHKIIAKENIKKDELLIVEYSEINLFGLNVESRELEILKIYLENKNSSSIQDLYPRSNKFIKTQLVKDVHKIVKSIKNINTKLYQSFSKYDKDTIELYYAKYIYNAFEGYDYGPLTLPIIAKINHSCKPNVEFKFNKESGTMYLCAIKDIKKNEEIFDSYLENKKIDSHQKYLQEHYGFDCRCSKYENLNSSSFIKIQSSKSTK